MSLHFWAYSTSGVKWEISVSYSEITLLEWDEVILHLIYTASYFIIVEYCHFALQDRDISSHATRIISRKMLLFEFMHISAYRNKPLQDAFSFWLNLCVSWCFTYSRRCFLSRNRQGSLTPSALTCVVPRFAEYHAAALQTALHCSLLKPSETPRRIERILSFVLSI